MRWLALVLPIVLGSCSKVPIYDVEAGFQLADFSYFVEERTLFVFYDVRAEQGIDRNSVVEIRYRTDTIDVPWTPLEDLDVVHVHEPVECSTDGVCGSWSVQVPDTPREVDIRLRYHRDGDLVLRGGPVYNVVGAGPPHESHSALVYGVFDETNTLVQWRLRHQFPTIRNQYASQLGLRRNFGIQEQFVAEGTRPPYVNPYGYGDCDAGESIEFGVVGSNDRAVWNAEPLPESVMDAAGVCGLAVVEHGDGTFATLAMARKNAQVRPAFPVLRSPVEDGRAVPFFLTPCRPIEDEVHQEMQQQRLLMEDLPVTCIDDRPLNTLPGFFRDIFREAVEEARVDGDDMVLTIGIHHYDDRVSEAVEEALEEILPPERFNSSPRLAGAFVFDTNRRGLSSTVLRNTTLWCPSTAFSPDASGRTCAPIPETPNIQLGPLTIGNVPILPSRQAYNDFIEEFGVGQAGRVEDLTVRVPEFSGTADNVDFGDFGVVSFLNNEQFSVEANDAFSVCQPEIPVPIVLRSPPMSSPVVRDVIELLCQTGQVSPDVCIVPATGVLPIGGLSQWHAIAGGETYEVGLAWDFPFLVQMEYQTSIAGSASAFGVSVPFGIATPGESSLGTPLWEAESFDLSEVVTHCTDHCEHPTFDPFGVYQVRSSFRGQYPNACYDPTFPTLLDGGFPVDP